MPEAPEVLIYVADQVVRDDRRPGDPEPVRYPIHAFGPIPPRSADWGDGHRRTESAGAAEPSFRVSVPAEGWVLGCLRHRDDRLFLPCRDYGFLPVDVLGMARDGLFGLRVAPLGGRPVPPPPFAVPPAAAGAIAAASGPAVSPPVPEPVPEPAAESRVGAIVRKLGKAEALARKLAEAEAAREARRRERETSGACIRVERDFNPPPPAVPRTQLGLFADVDADEPEAAGVAR